MKQQSFTTAPPPTSSAVRAAAELVRQRSTVLSGRAVHSVPQSPAKVSDFLKGAESTSRHADRLRQYVMHHRQAQTSAAIPPPQSQPRAALRYPASTCTASSSYMHNRLSYASLEAKRFEGGRFQVVRDRGYGYQGAGSLVQGPMPYTRARSSGIPRAAQVVLVR